MTILVAACFARWNTRGGMLTQLVCPACRIPITLETAEASCPQCHRVFPSRNGVLCFLDPDEVFNESPCDHLQKQDWSQTALQRDRIRASKFLSLLNLIRIKFSMSGRRDRIFLNTMARGPRDSLILDVGCGGGRHYLCHYGRVIGIDPVPELLQISKRLYAEVYQANALRLPFADNTFDYVVSSDVIGHIPEACKDRLFAEMHRVLKPGGRTVHVIETDSTNVWFRFGHRYPELFQKHFIDRPGHIGLELPTRLRERFLNHGFKEIAFKRIGGNVQACGTVAGFFDNEFKTHCKLLALLVLLDRGLTKNLLVQELANLVLEWISRIDDAISPLDHASGALVVFEKSTAADIPQTGVH